MTELVQIDAELLDNLKYMLKDYGSDKKNRAAVPSLIDSKNKELYEQIEQLIDNRLLTLENQLLKEYASKDELSKIKRLIETVTDNQASLSSDIKSAKFGYRVGVTILAAISAVVGYVIKLFGG